MYIHHIIIAAFTAFFVGVEADLATYISDLPPCSVSSLGIEKD